MVFKNGLFLKKKVKTIIFSLKYVHKQKSVFLKMKFFLKDKKLELEKEWLDNKENVTETDKKNEDEEISTTTADNENKSQSAAEVLSVIKNIDLFIKKSFPKTTAKCSLDRLFNDEEKNSTDKETEGNEREIWKKVIILTKEDLLELEKKFDEEILEEIRNFLLMIDSPQEYNCFATSLIVCKYNEKVEKFDDWLQEENVLNCVNLEKELKNEKNDVFKEILNFDVKYQRILESHLKKIEEMKESLNNLNLNLDKERGNFEKFNEKSSLITDNNLEDYFPQAPSEKYIDESLMNEEKNDKNKEENKNDQRPQSSPLRVANEEKNKGKIERNSPNFEERIVLRSKY